MEKLKVVLLESNQSVTKTLSLSLSFKYEIYTENDGISGIKKIIQINPQFIIIDLNIGGLSGQDVLKKLKQIGVKSPIFILSNTSDVKTKLEFYKLGAMDYLIKPFSVGELKAKLNAIEERMDILDLRHKHKKTNVSLNKHNNSVIRDNGQEIILRKMEYKILEYLINNAGSIVTRDNLTKLIWDKKDAPWSNSVDVHIKYLRDKIDRPFKSQLISTVHGQGYRIDLN